MSNIKLLCCISVVGVCMCVLNSSVLQLCSILRDLMDFNLPGFAVRGVFQVRMLVEDFTFPSLGETS